MAVWRMAFREGSQGESLWPLCFQYGVAAIDYEPVEDADLSRFSREKPPDGWRELKPSEKSSLAHVAWDMAKGDTIYVKEGKNIAGWGTVRGGYKFRLKRRIRDSCGRVWPHRVPVEWEQDFTPFEHPVCKHAPLHTVLRPKPEQVADLKRAALSALRQDKKTRVQEGSPYERIARFRQRNRSIVEAKKRASQGVCESCEMRFEKKYRLRDANVQDCLQVHHKNPLAEQSGVVVTTIDDPILLCPNCHAVVHAFRRALSLDELRTRVRK
ncbi:HNH endonuclease [Candidatus Sumerlaeota bacterium]|nr:HNH endonuclease [Candidatus Sumerlaeota bacterium]